MDPTSTLPTIGASGAIAGVMGAYFVLYPHSRVLTLIPLIIFCEIIELPAIFLLGFWFLMQLFSAGAIAVDRDTHGSGGVAFMAHVAGFVVGVDRRVRLQEEAAARALVELSRCRRRGGLVDDCRLRLGRRLF